MSDLLGCFLFLCILAAIFVSAFYVFIWGIIALAFIIKWMAIIGVILIVGFFCLNLVKALFD